MSSIVPSTASTASRESSEFEFVSGGNKEAAAKMKEPPKAPQVQANTNPVSEVQEEPDGLFGWVKGSGGLFSKVAEKTKSSVESVIITLDPQMKGITFDFVCYFALYLITARNSVNIRL